MQETRPCRNSDRARGGQRARVSAVPSSREPLFTSSFALVTAASLAYFISLGTLLPIIPRFIEGPLHGNSASVGFGVGSFGLFAFLIRPMAGRLADTRGRKLMMVGGSAMVAVASLGYLAVGHLVALIPLRLLAGTGEAMFFTGAASAVNDLALAVAPRSAAVALREIHPVKNDEVVAWNDA